MISALASQPTAGVLGKKIADLNRRIDESQVTRQIFPNPPATILKKITGLSSGKVLYTGRSWINPSAIIDPTSSTAITDAQLGTDPGGDDCYILNVYEKGWASGTYGWLTKIFPTATPYIEVGQYFGLASDGKPIFLVAVPLVNISLYCSLQQTGGATTSGSSPADWVYTAFRPGGTYSTTADQYGTSLSPTGLTVVRIPGASAATAGRGHINTAGAFVLDDAFEGSSFTTCSS